MIEVQELLGEELKKGWINDQMITFVRAIEVENKPHLQVFMDTCVQQSVIILDDGVLRAALGIQ